MRNRAKCKLCKKIIESLHTHDYQVCDCGEIAIDGGTSYYKASAKNFENFLRVDDDGNEVLVTVIDKEEDKTSDKQIPFVPPPPTKQEMLKMLDEMIKSIESLPDHALYGNVTQADHLSMLLLISSLFKT